MSPVSPLKLGILGCANIAKQFVRDVQGEPSIVVDAVASRDAAKAAAFADALGVPRRFDSYEALLADPAIDAIYLPLPNSMHAEWAIKAAAAGKHVLCEKPLALSHAQAVAMFDAARQHRVFLLEAYPFTFQPQFEALRGLLQSGALGDIRTVQASFGFNLAVPAGNIRMQPDLGGGALLDAGSYATCLIRSAMGQAPVKVMADSTWADSGVDIATSATLTYADGRRAQLSCAMNTAYHRHATIVGSQGVVETEYPNHTAAAAGDNPWGYVPGLMRLRRGTLASVAFEEVTAPSGSGFRFAAQAFARMVRDADAAAFERAAQTSLDIAATLEAIARSAKTGQAVSLT